MTNLPAGRESNQERPRRARIHVVPQMPSWKLSQLITKLPDIRGSRRAVLRTLADHYPDIFPNVATVATESGCGTTAARAALGDLLAEGWIEAAGNRKGGRQLSEQYFLNVDKIQRHTLNPTDSVALLTETQRIPTETQRIPSVNPTDSVAEQTKNRQITKEQTLVADATAREPLFELRSPRYPDGIAGVVCRRSKATQRRCHIGWCDRLHPASLPCLECGEEHPYVHSENDWDAMLGELYAIEPENWKDHEEWVGMCESLECQASAEAQMSKDPTLGCGCGYWNPLDVCDRDRKKPLTWRHVEGAATFFQHVYGGSFKRFTVKQEQDLIAVIANSVSTYVRRSEEIAELIWPVGTMLIDVPDYDDLGNVTARRVVTRAEILVRSNREANTLTELLRPKADDLLSDLTTFGVHSLYFRGRSRSFDRFPLATHGSNTGVLHGCN